ncbi:M81 family metallopeptidase [Devriesea agamarum]|uniref:M81 family metallopeptidase n=1 Tax=Devriesea agamarum TaxID=472569 RepID=UPI00071DAA73|nr:M81 family metallopeptidase [Devriesea agamarum]
MPRPRIVVCGLHIESSTFTPHRSRARDFSIRRGQQLLEQDPLLSGPLRDAADWVGIMHARALPGGQVVREDYLAWRDEICSGLAVAQEHQPLDGLFFDIHGAMAVEGMLDAEGDLITAIRQVIGKDVMVSASMDLHGNVSHTLFNGCDLLTCYRTAPHVDVQETRERAVRNLLAAIDSYPVRPYKALVHVPILLPGEITSTRVEPAASLYAEIPHLAAQDGVMDVSYWIGFAWADEPRCQAAVAAVGFDRDAVDAAALHLARAVWRARHEFAFVAPTASIEECLDIAMASSQRPFFISDSGDNPGAGGADDVTVALDALLRRDEVRSGATTVLVVSLVDPVTVQHAWDLPEGGDGTFTVGGRIDSRPPGPVPLRARVVARSEAPDTGPAVRLNVLARADCPQPGHHLSADIAKPTCRASSDGVGAPLESSISADREAPTGLDLVLTSRRAQYGKAEMFSRLGVDPGDYDLVVVKMGYLEPDLFAVQQGWMMALTPGGVDQNLRRLGHRQIARPMIPFDPEIPEPGDADIVRGW